MQVSDGTGQVVVRADIARLSLHDFLFSDGETFQFSDVDQRLCPPRSAPRTTSLRTSARMSARLRHTRSRVGTLRAALAKVPVEPRASVG